ncbi:MAG: hypothetical protein J6K97_04110 [Clostridia bacterium]|nr:hypothetical protein [Clostridia bacterium]
MINVVIPITKNYKNYHKILEALSGSFDIKVLLGVTGDDYSAAINEFQENENFQIFKFDKSADKEEMINALQEYIIDGSIMVLRKPVKAEEFDKMIGLERDVVTCKKVRNKFSAFMFKMWQRFTKLVLGVKMYAGDTSAIYFNDDISDVVVRSGNLSYSSRVNRWKGIKQAVLTVEGEAEKASVDKKANFTYILTTVLLIAAAVVITTCVCVFAKVTILLGLVLFCIDAIAVAISVILMTMLAFNNITGKRNVRKAIILDQKVKEDE